MQLTTDKCISEGFTHHIKGNDAKLAQQNYMVKTQIGFDYKILYNFALEVYMSSSNLSLTCPTAQSNHQQTARALRSSGCPFKIKGL